MILLYGLIKQSQALPLEDVELADLRIKQAHRRQTFVNIQPESERIGARNG